MAVRPKSGEGESAKVCGLEVIEAGAGERSRASSWALAVFSGERGMDFISPPGDWARRRPSEESERESGLEGSAESRVARTSGALRSWSRRAEHWSSRDWVEFAWVEKLEFFAVFRT